MSVTLQDTELTTALEHTVTVGGGVQVALPPANEATVWKHGLSTLPTGCLAETLTVAVPPPTATGTKVGPSVAPVHSAESEQPPDAELNGPTTASNVEVPLTLTFVGSEQTTAPAGATPMPVITGTVHAPATTAAAAPLFFIARRRDSASSSRCSAVPCPVVNFDLPAVSNNYVPLR